MTEHELTEEKIAELWDENHPAPTYFQWVTESGGRAARMMSFARAAYELGKQAANDDGFIPCTVDEIRKGDTVERTYTSRDGTIISVVGVAHYRDELGDWCSREGSLLIAAAGTSYTYRRKPAPVVHPDPEKHPIILDEDGDAWSWIGSLYQLIGEMDGYRNPEDFDGNWTPAHVVAKEEA